MTTSRFVLQPLWQRPRSIHEREEDRSVSFLELFYDLVYVVLVAQLAHALATHVDPMGVLGFAFLFAIVWIAWLNGTFYHDLHGNDDLRTRVFTFLQMITVASMAVFAHDALGDMAVGFALSYAAYLLVLTFLWWRTGVHDPAHAPLSRPYSLAYLVASALFVGSVFVDAPWRFALWAVAVAIALLWVFVTMAMGRRSAEIQAQVEKSFRISPSGVERFGLITIIVLGEVIVGAVNGLASQHHLTWYAGLTGLLGMLVAIGLWWIYFDYISHRPPLGTLEKTRDWIYLHLPMTAAIAATGAAILGLVEHAGEPLEAPLRWLFVGALALALLCFAGLMRRIRFDERLERAYARGSVVTLGCAAAILALGLTGLETLPLLAIAVLLLLLPVFYGLKVWLAFLATQPEEAAAS